MNIFSRYLLGITIFFLLGSFAYSSFLKINLIKFNTICIFISIPILIWISNIFYRGLKINFKKVNKVIVTTKELPNLQNFLYLSTSLSLIYFLLFLDLNLNGFNILTIPGQIAVRRYTDSLLMPGYLKVLRPFVNLASLIAVFEYLRSKSAIAILAFVLIIFDGLMSAGKAGPLQGALLCMTSLLGIFIYLKKPFIISLRLKVLVFTLFPFFLFITQLSRLKDFDNEAISYVFVRLFGYTFAGINAFDYWFNELYSNRDEMLFGEMTFSGFFDILGLSNRVQGIFSEGIVFANQPSTNVYTGIRSLVMDFGIVGGAIFIFIIGVVLNFILDKIKQSSYELIPLFSLITTYIIWNFFGSIMAYNTYVFTIILLYIILIWKRRITY